MNVHRKKLQGRKKTGQVLSFLEPTRHELHPNRQTMTSQSHHESPSSRLHHSQHDDLNSVEILELLERADMIDVTERPPGRNAISIRTRLLQVEWDLDKRLRSRYGPHHLAHRRTSASLSGSPTPASPSPTASTSSIHAAGISVTISSPSAEPPAELDDTWCLILNKVREANSKLLAMDRSFTPLPYSPGMKHFSPTVGPQQSGPPELEDNDIKYNPKTDYIGEGSYGVVYKGTCRGKKVAIKVPKRKLGPRQIEQFKSEIAMMSKIYHPNIVLFMGACIKPTIKIVTELCSTDLDTLLQVQPMRLSLFDRMKMAVGAALGMNWLHGICNIIHRDLKTANLLVTEDGTVKVADFGFGQFFGAGSQSPESRCGTPLWMAPEVILGEESNELLDVYSFGIILWQLVSLKKPFYHLDIKSWEDFKHYICVEKQRPIMPSSILPILSYLINRCWHTNPEERPSFSEIVFRLQEVLVDCVIHHEGGRKFWREHFLLNQDALVETVEWPTFCSILFGHLALDFSPSPARRDSKLTSFTRQVAELPRTPSPTRRLKSEEDKRMIVLRHFLLDNEVSLMSSRGPCVSMKSFDRTIFFFGDFTSREYGASILDTIMVWVSLPYFHGDISKEEVSVLLPRYEVGTFLVRLSSTTIGKPITLSVLTSTTHIDHRRITVYNPGREDRQYTTTIENRTYSAGTLHELIGVCTPVLKLQSPCPKKFEWTSDYLS